MKLASYRDGSRDGQLVVVSRDLSMALYANGIASRLQQVLDDWNFLSPQLQDLSLTLNHGKARHAFAFDPAMCLAPLPRAPRWVRASAYLGPLERACRARGVEPPARLKSEPVLRAAASDLFVGATQDVVFRSAAAELDFEAQWAVAITDIAAGAGPEQALDGVRLVGLLNDWTQRALADVESVPAGWAPVMVTLDELGDAWQRGRLALQVEIRRNGQRHARLASGEGMQFHVGQLLATLARQRALTAGTLLSSGAIGQEGAQPAGCASLMEARVLATAAGKPLPAYLQDGDDVQIDAVAADGQSVFGALTQNVVTHD
jgi:fumarylacetoacetate (FAA) hydrolase